MAKDKQEQTRLQGASGQLKPYKRLWVQWRMASHHYERPTKLGIYPSHPLQIISLVKQDLRNMGHQVC